MPAELLAPWAAPAVRARLREVQAPTTVASAEDRARFAAALCRQRERDDLVLYAGTNAIADPHAQLGTRPSMGLPGEKVQQGLEDVEVLEILTSRAVAATMGATWVDVRPQSATVANLAVYAALTPVGATLAVLPPWAGAHASHAPGGTPALRGHRVVELPYDEERHDVDLAALPAFLAREHPALVVVGGSLVLFPYRLVEIAALAHAAGAALLYDASHTAGLIAGGRFQDPLEEGADVVTFSTYKSYGGPAGGAIATREPSVAERVARVVYPQLTSNYDASRLPGLYAAACELLAHGERYADDCIAAARALAQALADAGLPVVAAARGFTASHHVAVACAAPDAAVRALARAGIHASATTVPGPVAALRLGTQEIVRRGRRAADIAELARHIAETIDHEEAAPHVHPAV